MTANTTPSEGLRRKSASGFRDFRMSCMKKAAEVCSESQLYKQAGNAVTVSVAEAVARKIIETEENQDETL